MQRVLVFVCLSLALLPLRAVAQTNPCTAGAPTGVVFNPNTVYLALPDLNATIPNVTPPHALYDAFEVAYWPQGANTNTSPPTLGPFPVIKAAWNPVAGAPDCYSLVWPSTIPTGGAPLVNAFRKRREVFAGDPIVFSPYSAAGNPFQTVSTALAAPGQPINTRQ